MRHCKLHSVLHKHNALLQKTWLKIVESFIMKYEKLNLIEAFSKCGPWNISMLKPRGTLHYQGLMLARVHGLSPRRLKCTFR